MKTIGLIALFCALCLGEKKDVEWTLDFAENNVKKPNISNSNPKDQNEVIDLDLEHITGILVHEIEDFYKHAIKEICDDLKDLDNKSTVVTSRDGGDEQDTVLEVDSPLNPVNESDENKKPRIQDKNSQTILNLLDNVKIITVILRYYKSKGQSCESKKNWGMMKPSTSATKTLNTLTDLNDDMFKILNKFNIALEPRKEDDIKTSCEELKKIMDNDFPKSKTNEEVKKYNCVSITVKEKAVEVIKLGISDPCIMNIQILKNSYKNLKTTIKDEDIKLEQIVEIQEESLADDRKFVLTRGNINMITSIDKNVFFDQTKTDSSGTVFEVENIPTPLTKLMCSNKINNQSSSESNFKIVSIDVDTDFYANITGEGKDKPVMMSKQVIKLSFLQMIFSVHITVQDEQSTKDVDTGPIILNDTRNGLTPAVLIDQGVKDKAKNDFNIPIVSSSDSQNDGTIRPELGVII